MLVHPLPCVYWAYGMGGFSMPALPTACRHVPGAHPHLYAVFTKRRPMVHALHMKILWYVCTFLTLYSRVAWVCASSILSPVIVFLVRVGWVCAEVC